MTRDEMVAELRTELGVISAADQAYTAAVLNSAVQRAYTDLIKRANIEGNKTFSQYVVEFTWPADQLRLTLPNELASHRWLDAMDYTAGEPGEPLIEFVDFSWYDHKTLQWLRSSTGPEQARSIRAFYSRSAETLLANGEPALIPPDHHRLIVVKARNQLRSSSDDYLPGDWKEELRELMLDFMKYVMSARPISNPQKLLSTSEDYQY